jgi:hypothetical protein
MTNSIFKDLIKVNIESMISKSSSIESIDHKGLKGTIREYGIGSLISKYLPQEWTIGHGEIQDSEGNSSAEIDLLIYNLNILPAALFGNELGVYPIESCKYVFEVKTTSTASEIKSTIRKFEKLKQLKPTRSNLIPVRVYFAFRSDLNENINELERYKKYDSKFYIDPAFNVICVIGQGYWFYKQDFVNGIKVGGWLQIPDEQDYMCVSNLIGGMINTLKGDDKPHFGEYILSKGQTTLVDYAQI